MGAPGSLQAARAPGPGAQGWQRSRRLPRARGGLAACVIACGWVPPSLERHVEPWTEGFLHVLALSCAAAERGSCFIFPSGRKLACFHSVARWLAHLLTFGERNVFSSRMSPAGSQQHKPSWFCPMHRPCIQNECCVLKMVLLARNWKSVGALNPT